MGVLNVSEMVPLLDEIRTFLCSGEGEEMRVEVERII